METVILAAAIMSAVAGPEDHRPGEQIVLIDGGVCRAAIVLPCQASFLERKAAEELQCYLAQIGGTEIPICAEGDSREEACIFVGRTERGVALAGAARAEKQGPEGFVIKTGGSEVAIVGGGDYGTLYGAYELLERYLGVRWYLPDPLGEIVPRREVVAVPSIDDAQSPSFEMRWVGTDTTWNLRNKMNRVSGEGYPPAFRVTPGIYHTQSKLVPRAKYFHDHPEYFALVGGKRSDDPEAKLCYSNPDLPEVVAQNMAGLLHADPRINLISFSPTDGQLWCECAACRALDEPDVAPDQRYSRRSLVFYNRVAEHLARASPEQRILVGAYNVYNQPPKDTSVKAHPSLWVIITHYDDYCMAHPVDDPDCPLNARYRALIADWQARVSDVCFYEYYHKVNWLSLPWPIVHSLARDIPYFRDIGVKGLYTQYSRANLWTNFLGYYVAARLLWNSGTDVDALLEEFYPNFYGRAAKPMRRYYETLERAMGRSPHHYPGDAMRNGHLLLTPKLVAKLDRRLRRAEAIINSQLKERMGDFGLIGPDDPYHENLRIQQRLAKVRVSLDYTRAFTDYLEAKKGLRTVTGEKAFHRALDRANGGLARIAEFARRGDDAASGVLLGNRILRAVKAEEQALAALEAPERASAPELGLLSDWMVLGPFDNTDWSGHDRVYPPEEDLNLRATYQGKHGRVGWRCLRGRPWDGYIDLAAHFGGENWAVAYAARFVNGPEPVEAQLRVGSNDSIVVWVGGKKVHDRKVERRAHLDEDIVPITLPAGRTRVLLKVCQAAHDWGFFFRITDPAGNPLLNLP